MKIRWTQQARQDLLEVGRYIAQRNPVAAQRWTARIRERVKKIVLSPFAGRMVPELMREEIRELIEKNYRIVYQVGDEFLDVLTVFEAHRLFPIEHLPQEDDNSQD